MMEDIFEGTDNPFAKITDKALGKLFSDRLREILGMGIFSEDQRSWALGLPLIHKILVERFVIDDDYIDNSEERIKLILASTLGVGGKAREQMHEMLQTQNRILTLGELEKNRGVIR